MVAASISIKATVSAVRSVDGRRSCLCNSVPWVYGQLQCTPLLKSLALARVVRHLTLDYTAQGFEMTQG